MKVKLKRRFLYLAIACFVGLVTIFVVDGYMGIYDTVYVTIGEYTQKIEAAYWLQERPEYAPVPVSGEGDEVTYYISARVEDNVSFRYVIENHQFSDYYTLVQSSVWQENEKVLDLFSGNISVKPFGKGTAEWKLSSEDLGITTSTQCTVRISHGDIERRIIVDFYVPEESPYYIPKMEVPR